MPLRPASALLLSAALVSCVPPQGVTRLDFRLGPPGTEISAQRLLLDQVIPADRVLSIPEALKRAPNGSVILACNRQVTFTSFWGACTHLTRKLSDGVLSDTPGFFKGGVFNRPESSQYPRYAVIVLDVGVKEEQLPILRAEAERLKGTPYMIGGTGTLLDCTTYQNLLQRTLGLPDVAELNPMWNLWLPQDAMTGPAMRQGGKVLFVGLEGK